MATFNMPALIPTWCEDNPSNLAQPADSLRATGYVANEPIMAENFNWLLNSYGNWIGYLNQANGATVQAASLEINMRLVSGGAWSYNANTTTLSWASTAYLSIPSIALADNSIAAGSVILGANVVAYVTANIPVPVTGSITAGDDHVQNVLSSAGLVVGQTVTGNGIPANTTLTAISDDTLTLSAAATATSTSETLVFAGAGSLSVQSAPAQSFVPGPSTVVIAVGREDHAIVGANSGQMRLAHNESKSLLADGYVSTFSPPAGAALNANTPVYISLGLSDGRTQGAAYPCEANATNGAQRGQFLGFVPNAYSQGNPATVVTSGILNGFSNLLTGLVYYLDPANVGGITTTRPTATGLFIAPVGIAVSATQLKINPPNTNALTAIQSGLTVNGNLVVKPTAAGGAFQVYATDGQTLVAQSTDTGILSANSVVSGAGFKSFYPFGGTAGNGNTTQQFLQTVIANPSSSSGVAAVNGVFSSPYPTSLVGITATVNTQNNVTAYVNLLYIANNQAGVGASASGSGMFLINKQFVKNAYPLAANTGIALFVSFSSNPGSWWVSGGIWVESPA